VNAFNPYMSQVQSYGPRQELVRVTGIDGAKAYQMGPNSSAALFDANDDLLYIKSTDGAGFPSLRTFRFTEVQSAPAHDDRADYVTREEVSKLVKKAIEEAFNGEQSV